MERETSPVSPLEQSNRLPLAGDAGVLLPIIRRRFFSVFQVSTLAILLASMAAAGKCPHRSR
jgi:hypothetical protein